MSVFGMVLPSYLYAKGAPFIETGLAAILGSIELPVVIVFSSVLLNETTSLTQWVGIVVILLGIVVSERKTGSRSSGKAST